LSLGDKIERLTDACMNVRKIYVRQSCGLIYRFLVPSSNLSCCAALRAATALRRWLRSERSIPLYRFLYGYNDTGKPSLTDYCALGNNNPGVCKRTKFALFAALANSWYSQPANNPSKAGRL